MTSWIEWVACGTVVVIVVACMFDQIRKEAEEDRAALKLDFFGAFGFLIAGPLLIAKMIKQLINQKI